MAPSRTHHDIQAVLLNWGSEVLLNIEQVSIDLLGNYQGAVRRLMPQAEVVADRSYVMKLINKLRYQPNRALFAGKKENSIAIFAEKIT